MSCILLMSIAIPAASIPLLFGLFFFIVVYCQAKKFHRREQSTKENQTDSAEEPATSSRERPIRSAADFKRLLVDRKIPVPFRLIKYGPYRLYTHHILVTGWVENGDDDYLLTTVEYTAGGTWRGWWKCLQTTGDFLKTIHRIRQRLWGRIKIQVLSLREQISEHRPISLLEDDPNQCKCQCRCKEPISMDEAEKLLWNPTRIKECLRRFKEMDLKFARQQNGPSKDSDGPKQNMDEIFQCLLQPAESNPRDDTVFRTLATRLEEIMSENKWSAGHNSCEHLVNFLLSGRHQSDQLENAKYHQLFLLHMIGPIFEMHFVFRLLIVLPNAVAIVLGSLIQEHLKYAICIVLIYAIEFLPTAMVIGGLFGLEKHGRTDGCGRVWLETLTRSTLNTFAISAGCLAGHWHMDCWPSIWDEMMLGFSLFAFAHFFVFPMFAAGFNVLIRKRGAGYEMCTRFVVFLLIISGPVVLLGPYFFEVMGVCFGFGGRKNCE